MLEYMHKLLDEQDCDCARCERPLTDLPSKMRGYGPQCYEKMLDKVRSYGIVVEAVEVPMHAICYLLYGEEEGMPEGAKESADEWMDENNYEMIGLSYGYYEEIWVKHKKLYPEEDYGPDDTDNPFFDSHISRSVAFGPYWMSDCYYCDFAKRGEDWDQQRWNEVFGTEQC